MNSGKRHSKRRNSQKKQLGSGMPLKKLIKKMREKETAKKGVVAKSPKRSPKRSPKKPAQAPAPAKTAKNIIYAIEVTHSYPSEENDGTYKYEPIRLFHTTNYDRAVSFYQSVDKGYIGFNHDLTKKALLKIILDRAVIERNGTFDTNIEEIISVEYL